MEAFGDLHPETLQCLHETVLYMHLEGDNESAVPLSEECWEKRKATFGEDNHRTLTSQFSKALCYSKLPGHLPIAEETFEDCLRIRQRVMGADSQDALACERELAFLCTLRVAEMSADATSKREKTLKRGLVGARECLKRHTSVLGPEHRDSLECQYRLSCLLHDLGEVEEALEVARANVDSRRRVLGTTVQTFMSQYHLAVCARKRMEQLRSSSHTEDGMDSNVGSQEEIFACERESVRSAMQCWVGRRKMHGMKHEHAVSALKLLLRFLKERCCCKDSDVYGAAEEYQEMSLKEEEALAAVSEVLLEERSSQLDLLRAGGHWPLPPASPITHVMVAAASLLFHELDAEQLSAHLDIKLLETFVHRQKALLGETHPDTVESIQQLVRCLLESQRVEEARALQESVVRGLSEDHPQRVAAQLCLALISQTMGEHEEAVQMAEEVLSSLDCSQSKPDALVAQSFLFSLRQHEASAVEAKAALVQQWREILRPQALTALGWRSEAADIKVWRGVVERACASWVEMPGDVLGERTLTVLVKLAESLVLLGEKRVAREVLRVVSAEREQLLGRDHPNTLRALSAMLRASTA